MLPSHFIHIRNETGDYDIYTLDIITIYKAEDGGDYTDEISFTLQDCGETLTLGEEYLIGLNGPDDDGVFAAPVCHGVRQLWSSVGTEGLDCGIDPCYGACDDYEVFKALQCLRHMATTA